MDIDFSAGLSLRTVHTTSPAVLVRSVKAWLEREGPSCLVHPNGFWVVLLNRSRDVEWRLHVWPKGPRATSPMSGMIHTHNRILDSRVILGGMRNTLYRELTRADVSSVGRPVYEVSYRGDRFAQGTLNVLERTGTCVRIGPMLEQNLGVGDCYRVPADTYHEVSVEDCARAATIVCMHSPVSRRVKVLGLGLGRERLSFQRSSGSAEELLEWLA